MHHFGSAAITVLGILAAGTAFGGVQQSSAPCDRFEKEHGSPCVSSEPGPDGRTQWLVGAASGLPTADAKDVVLPAEAPAGPVDFTRLPLVTPTASIPFAVRTADRWREVNVEHNGEKLDVAVAGRLVKTAKPVALRTGMNLFRVRLGDGKSAPIEVTASVRRLSKDQVEELAMARAYLDEVGPLLGIEPHHASLLPTRFQAFAPEGGKDPALSRIGFRVAIAGVPVEGAGVSVVLTREPVSKKVVPVGLYNGVPDLGKAPIKLGKTVTADEARRALAREYAGGDERFVSQPVLRWVPDANGRLQLTYHAYFYGRHSSVESFDTDEVFTIAALATDAATASHHTYGDMVRKQFPVPEDGQFPLVGHGRVFDGPLDDLDQALRVHRVDLDETRRTIEGHHEFCAAGEYAEVKNNSNAEHLLYRNGGHRVCGGLDRNAEPDLARNVLEYQQLVQGGPSAEDDTLEAWTSYSHTNIAAKFVRRHVGFVHEFENPERPSQLHVAINPQFRGYGAAVTNVRDTAMGTEIRRQGIFLGRSVRWAETRYGGQTYLMSADFARDRNTIYHEYAHTVLNAVTVTTRDAFFDPMVGVVHEGFADYVARIITGNDRQPSPFLYDEPEEHPSAAARFCGPLLPGDDHFLALDPASPRDQLREAPLGVGGHIYGQAFCQALSLAEHWVAETPRRPGHAILWVAVVGAGEFPNSVWIGQDSEAFVPPLIFAASLLNAIQSLAGLDVQPIEHELRTALALHGLNGDPVGRTAAVAFEGGAYRTVEAGEALDSFIATGVTHTYELRFSRDENGADTCFEQGGNVSPLEEASTGYTRRSTDVSTLIEACGGGSRVYVTLETCDPWLSCDEDPSNRRVLGGAPIWFDLGQG